MRIQSERKPLISVLLPTRNRAALLRFALASVQRQTLREIEILVLDDCSEDGTRAIIEEAQTLDARVRAFQGNGKGASSAMNRMIQEARADHVAIMHDDDISLPQRLVQQLSYANHFALDVCGTWCQRFGRTLGGIARPPTEDEAIRTSLHFQPALLHPSVLIKRRWLETVGGYDENCHLAAEDFDLWTRLAIAGARFGNVPKVLLRYRVSPAQASRVFNTEQVLLAHNIRARYLIACGLTATPEQMMLQVRVRDPDPIESMRDLHAFEDWLLTLQRKFAASSLAAKVVARQWLFVGCRAAGLGMRCWRVWRASPLAAATDSKKAALLATLCAGRIRYRAGVYRLFEAFAPA
jgi:GT2 family glycosyltransferase